MLNSCRLLSYISMYTPCMAQQAAYKYMHNATHICLQFVSKELFNMWNDFSCKFKPEKFFPLVCLK